MSRTDAQMKIRLPADLKSDLEQSAKANRRSLNAEIVARLDDSFSFDDFSVHDIRLPAFKTLDENLIDIDLNSKTKSDNLISHYIYTANLLKNPVFENLSKKIMQFNQNISEMKLFMTKLDDMNILKDETKTIKKEKKKTTQQRVSAHEA